MFDDVNVTHEKQVTVLYHKFNYIRRDRKSDSVVNLWTN